MTTLLSIGSIKIIRVNHRPKKEELELAVEVVMSETTTTTTTTTGRSKQPSSNNNNKRQKQVLVKSTDRSLNVDDFVSTTLDDVYTSIFDQLQAKGVTVGEDVQKELRESASKASLKEKTNTFKNNAYGSGFMAGTSSRPSF